ncbi:AGE family epimerase/isomerase [Adhaeretor mobilis]|uniref:Cellobiose 2-epimerase n=1 Tax=Adhaeretor mobilis TaxID=1930276 RepID=A0A517MW09_9BACT|nr:AGE family epimerase/isomerase [Adhaeretor mobilis]QDS99070.1 Cellobiose 2-epimerase [Adhaeretor mobilis]
MSERLDDNATSLSRHRIEELIRVYRDGLLEDVIPFWINHCVDSKHGGFTMSLGQDGTVIDDDKGVWQQGRFTWLLGKLHNQVESRDDWLVLARHGIDFIDRYCFDKSDGRMWFLLTRDGNPLRKRRYAFSESFAAIAYGEFAKATGSDEYAEKARKAFQEFIDHSFNGKGSLAKFTDTRPMTAIGFPMIAINVAQELRESIGLEEADRWIDRWIERIQTLHVKEDIQCVMETVGANGELLDHFDGRTLNPGHAIEGAWFIMREGKLRNDQGLIRLGCQMLDWMWERGWDRDYGGMLYFVDAKGLPVQEYWHDMKFWWPQNEVIIATLLAYQLTGEVKYARWHTLAHDWAFEHFPDAEHGEWFGYLHRDGRRSVSLKGNHWKGPFHLPRMQLNCWKIMEEIQESLPGIKQSDNH